MIRFTATQDQKMFSRSNAQTMSNTKITQDHARLHCKVKHPGNDWKAAMNFIDIKS